MKIIAPKNNGGQQKLAEILGTPVWWYYTRPFSWIRAGLQAVGDDVWIVYWNPVFSLPLFVIYLLAKTRLNIIVENALPHHKFPFALQIIRYFLRRSGRVIVYSRKVYEQLAPFCEPQLQTLPHGAEMEFDQPLPVDANMVLMLGFIRGYKGLDTLLDAIPAVLREFPRVTFYVVGKFRGLSRWQYRTRLKQFPSENLKVINRRVTDEEFKQYIQRAAVMVFPYKRITQSGVMNYALKAGKKIVATPVFKEFLPPEDIYSPNRFARGIMHKLQE